ncbi:hypothetical protein [Pseudomonas entomophila]|uniref:hypothetical protein n=1 Tax=Pseudomonas entomophila TaxID=312306 RepID=UPI001F00FD54|nr:hypothetical protein [Pseudomonas entomophila]MCG8291427.1 hypothetical protein [Pseudomonas entomophila]
MKEPPVDSQAVLTEAQQVIEESNYKHRLLQELLGQFRRNTAPHGPPPLIDAMASPLASAQALMAERAPRGDREAGGVRQRRPLRMRGLVI